jgi:hypothetical protein
VQELLIAASLSETSFERVRESILTTTVVVVCSQKVSEGEKREKPPGDPDAPRGGMDSK